MNWHYSNSKIVTGSIISLDYSEVHHVYHVMRAKEGDSLILFDGKGTIGICTIKELSKTKVNCIVDSHQHFLRNEFEIIMMVSAPKSAERFDFMVEKLVETGTDKLIFINTQRTERTRINFDRVQKQIIAASKQSKRPYLMEVFELNYSNALNLYRHCVTKYIFSVEEAGIIWTPSTSITSDISILIGPEGDFTDLELALAKENGYQFYSLGKNILRTETAAIVVAAEMNLIRERQKN